MRIALTGASGLVGRALARGLSSHDIVTLGRRPAAPHLPHLAWDLTGPAPDLSGFDALVHAALSHAPGRYRGGEGDDPKAFLTANLDGTRSLFDAAAEGGVARIVFLSSRAVFDKCPPGTELTETLPPDPDSLYGKVKAAAEAHLLALPLTGHALRATGVYGPGSGHKWEGLFADYLAGRPVAPRVGTELHADDLAAACRLLLLAAPPPGAYHASDILVDRRDLMAEVRRLTACPHPLPERADTTVDALCCERLPALGWQPRGWAGLRAALPSMLP